MRGFGDTEADPFEQAGVPGDRVVIHCEALNEDLLVDAVARRMASSRMLFSRFEVWLDGLRLTACVG